LVLQTLNTSTKRYFFLIIVLGVSIFYLIGTFNTQISTWAHDFSHHIKAYHPDTIDYNKASLQHTHSLNNLKIETSNHEHSVLGVFKSLFKSFDGETPFNKSILTHFKISKYIVNNSLRINGILSIIDEEEVNSLVIDMVKKGYFQKILIPPRV